MDQRTSKFITYLIFTRMSRVYWLKVCLRYLKLKQTVHYIVIIRKLFVSIILEGDKSFHLNGNNLLIADHPNNINQGGFCIYYKESLIAREVKMSDLSQCVICGLSLQNCKRYIGVVYRSPSQDSTKFGNMISINF